MRKVKVSLLFFLIGFALQAQTSLWFYQSQHLQDSIDNCTYCCNKHIYYENVWVGGMAYGYPLLDTIQETIYYGDGSSDVFYDEISDYNEFGAVLQFDHHYALPGDYDIMVVVKASDGLQDTVINAGFHVFDYCDVVSGSVYYDQNFSCTDDNETAQSTGYSIRVFDSLTEITDEVLSAYYPDHYELYIPDAANLEIVPITSFYVPEFCPPNRIVDPVNLSSHDFGIQCTQGPDITGTLSTHCFSPGQYSFVSFCPVNLSCWSMLTTATMYYDTSALTFTFASKPCAAAGDSLVFTFPPVMSSYFDLYLNNVYVNFLTDSTASLGDTLWFHLKETSLVGDIDTTNNRQKAYALVTNSWDPNEKTVTPNGDGMEGYIPPGQDLGYTIFFQNTGTDTAYQVRILDTLDEHLAAPSFLFIGASHDVSYDFIDDKVVRFTFDQIMLPDSGTDYENSQGYVHYFIHQQGGLTHGTRIWNSAAIFFDFNLPVITNTVLNTIWDPPIATPDPAVVEMLSATPNPSDARFFISTGSNVAPEAVEVFDLRGQEQRSTFTMKNGGVDLDLGALPSGIYIVRVKQSGSVMTVKCVRY